MQGKSGKKLNQFAPGGGFALSVKSLSLSAKIAIGFALPILLMSIVSTAVYFSTNSLVDTARWVQHTQEVISDAHFLEKLIVDMETGERGFLITGKDSFLEPFVAAEDRWYVTIEDLKMKVEDNPQQVKNLESISQKAGQWITLAATPEIIQRRKVQDNLISLDHIQAILQKKVGKNILGKIRSLSSELDESFKKSRNHKASNLLISILKDIVDQEAGERGFLITGEDEFLDSYKQGKNNFSRHVSELKSLVLNSPSSEEVLVLIDEVEHLAGRWEEEAALPEIQIRKTQKQIKQAEAEALFYDMQTVLSKGTGKSILDKLRITLTKLNTIYSKAENEAGQIVVLALSKAMVDQETGQRGYLITGLDQYLTPFNEGKDKFKNNIAMLRDIVANSYDSNEVIKTIESIESSMQDWHTKAAKVEIDARREINASGLSPMENLQKMVVDGIDSDLLLDNKKRLTTIAKRLTGSKYSEGLSLVLRLEKEFSEQLANTLHYLVSGSRVHQDEFKRSQEVISSLLLELSVYTRTAYAAEDTPDMKKDVDALTSNTFRWYQNAIGPVLHARGNIQQSRFTSAAQIQNVLKQGEGKKILDATRVLLKNIQKDYVDAGNQIGTSLILQIEKYLVDQETGQRGFIITGDESFLDPYYDGIKNLRISTAKLVNVAKDAFDIGDTLSKIAVVQSEIDKWISIAAEPEIALRRKVNASKERFNKIESVIAQGRGKGVLDNLRYLQDELHLIFERAKNKTAQRLVIAISKDIVDMEAGQRGFLITGKKEYLQPFELGGINVAKHIVQLQNIVKSGYSANDMLAKIAELRSMTDLWLEKAGEPEIQLRKNLSKVGASMSDVTRLIEKETGKNIIDSIRSEINNFIEIEQALIEIRSADAEKAASTMIYQAVVGTIIAMMLAFFTAAFLLKTILNSLKIISDGTQRIATGDYSVKIAIETTDQIGALSESFNQMAEQLDSASKAMVDSQQELTAQKAAMDEHSLVSVTDIRGNIIYANDKFCEISGYSREELVGENHRVLNSAEQPEDYWRQMYLTVSRGGVWHDEVCNKARNGRYYWVDTTIIPLYDTTEKLHGYISIRTDISRSKILAEELVESKEEAEAATRAKTAFLATMSHEIRTPMNGVLGMAQLMEDTPLTDQQKGYLATIASSGNNLLSIINDILDFSKLEVDKTSLESIDFDLEQICAEVLELSTGISACKKVTYIFDYKPDCPRYFVGDPSRIRQVLINLVGNAAKFTQQGSIRLGVKEEGEGAVRVEVEDTGLGLKPEACGHLFEEFTQADNTTTREYGGTGLGLAITQKLVTLMGGEIGVDSVYGEGSTFYMTLNLPIAKTLHPVSEASLDDIRILFVDDNEVNRRIYKHMLEHMGANPTVIEKRDEALDVLRQAQNDNHPFEIAVFDHSMSGMSSLELGMEIRKHYSVADLKLFVFSSAGIKGDAATFYSAGFNAYLNKPDRYEVLQSILSSLRCCSQGDQLITRYNMKNAQKGTVELSLGFDAKILLVEDVAANQLVARLMLQALGIEVDIANNGLEAIEQYQDNNDYDLIFMDCRMPVLDGYEATAAIRQLESEHRVISPIPIIALTANTSPDERQLCKSAGMDDIVTKPIDRTDLASALLQWLPESCQSQDSQKGVRLVSESSAVQASSEEIDALAEIKTLDESILEVLKDQMGEKFQEMMDVSYNDIQTCIDKLMTANVETAISDMSMCAHSIKSPANYVGAMRLSYMAETLEADLTESGDGGFNESIIQAIQGLHDEFEKLKQEMEQLTVS